MTVAARPAPPPAGAAHATAGGPFVLSFDFEDWHQLVYRRLGRGDWRIGSAAFEQHVRNALDLLDDLDVQATFFVLGATAERHPWALREVVARGHELGCHGYEHRRAYQQTPGEFRDDVVRCLDVIAGVCDVTPIGFRAPWFSITRRSEWVHEILEQLGFQYDSSLYDSPRIRQRIQPIPGHPFRVGSLWEFPIAVWKRGGVVLPLGGGAYWRTLPGTALWHGLESVARDTTFPVLYFHPYEFAEEPLQVVLPARATLRARTRETSRRLYKNVRRDLIPVRLRETAARFRLVSFRDALDAIRG